jgi:membrane-anchored protein YejM (alkaline phosphatase superfamily)
MNFQFVRPSMGAWVLYGLGTENEELPGFITINPVTRVGGAQNYGSAFLPAAYQGTRIGGEGEPLARTRIANISNAKTAGEAQRAQLDLLQSLNRDRLAQDRVNNELEGVIESYELAFRMIDQPIAALIADLKQRDLLRDTLLVWGGEFGRTPSSQNTDGRDHNGTGFSMWMAGGGVKGGIRYGATDEHGVNSVENKMHIHDMHATMLHLLGIEHERLTYRYSGRDFRLTDLAGNVAHEILA